MSLPRILSLPRVPEDDIWEILDQFQSFQQRDDLIKKAEQSKLRSGMNLKNKKESQIIAYKELCSLLSQSRYNPGVKYVLESKEETEVISRLGEILVEFYLHTQCSTMDEQKNPEVKIEPIHAPAAKNEPNVPPVARAISQTKLAQLSAIGGRTTSRPRQEAPALSSRAKIIVRSAYLESQSLLSPPSSISSSDKEQNTSPNPSFSRKFT